MRRTVTTTTASGEDTTYTVSFTGSYYPLQIDQLNQTITSATPLPVGTRVNAVLVTVSFEGGLLYAPAADTTSWSLYSSKDSLDFTSPILFRVFASDGSGYRDYTASLTVLQADPDAYTWQQMPAASMLASRRSTRLLEHNGTLVAMSLDESGCMYLASKASDDTWTESPCTDADGIDPRTVQSYSDVLYATTADGNLLSSADGVSWAAVPTARPLTLLAASATALYAAERGADAASPHTAIVSSQDGQNWQPMAIESDDFAVYPIASVASVAYQQTNGTDRVLVAGQTAGATATVWSLREGSTEPWILFSTTGDNPYALQTTAGLNIVAYNNMLLAIDNDIRVSRDNGITWKASEQLTAPAELQAATEAVAAAVMGDYIYITAGSNVWRVKLNGQTTN